MGHRLPLPTSCNIILISEVESLSLLAAWSDDTVVTTQVHESKETQQSIIVSVEVTVLEGYVLGVPQCIDKLFLLLMLTHHGGCCRRGNESDAVAQLAESASLQYLVTLG